MGAALEQAILGCIAKQAEQILKSKSVSDVLLGTRCLLQFLSLSSYIAFQGLLGIIGKLCCREGICEISTWRGYSFHPLCLVLSRLKSL